MAPINDTDLLNQLKKYTGDNQIEAQGLQRVYKNYVDKEGNPASSADMSPDELLDKTLTYDENKMALETGLAKRGFQQRGQSLGEASYDAAAEDFRKEQRRKAEEKRLEAEAQKIAEAEAKPREAKEKEKVESSEVDALLFGKKMDKEAVGNSGNIVDYALEKKAGLNRIKLKYEASHVGITPQQFDELEKKNKLQDVYMAILLGHQNEAKIAKDEAYRKRYAAGTRNIESIYGARDVATEAKFSEGSKPVYFGSTNFGKNKIPLNAQTHGSLREKYLPTPATGVQRSVENSRLGIVKLRESAMRPATPYYASSRNTIGNTTGGAQRAPAYIANRGGVQITPGMAVPPAVLMLQPNRGKPFVYAGQNQSAVARLAPNAGSPVLHRLSANPQAYQQSNALAKLGTGNAAPASGGGILARLSPKRRSK